MNNIKRKNHKNNYIKEYEDNTRYKIAMHTANVLSMPEDVFLSSMIITLTGKNHGYVENYNAIIEFTDKILKLQGKHTRVMITGKNFIIHHFNKNALELRGIINEVKYYT